ACQNVARQLNSREPSLSRLLLASLFGSIEPSFMEADTLNTFSQWAPALYVAQTCAIILTLIVVTWYTVETSRLRKWTHQLYKIERDRRDDEEAAKRAQYDMALSIRDDTVNATQRRLLL